MKREQASRIRVGTLFLLFLLFLRPFLVEAQQSPESIGSVVALEPEVLLFHRGQTRWMRARLRDKIFLYDTVYTRERGKVQVLFQDDSLLTLGESARIEVSEHIYQPAENRRSSVFRLFTGKVRAIVGAAFAAEGSRFQVHTPTAVVGTRLTQFIVWVVSPDLTIVIVLEGEVVIRNIVETVVGEAIVREGFMTQIEINQPPIEPVPAPLGQMDQLMRDTRVPKAAFSARAEAPPAGEGKAEEKPAEEKPAEEKPAEEKPAEEKPAEEKPAEEKPAEEKPVEEKAAAPAPAPAVEAAPAPPAPPPGLAPGAEAPAPAAEAVPPAAAMAEALPPPPPLGAEVAAPPAPEPPPALVPGLADLLTLAPPPSVPEPMLQLPSLEVSPPLTSTPTLAPEDARPLVVIEEQPPLPGPPGLPPPPGRP